MARQKISEFTAKSLLLDHYQGFAAPETVSGQDVSSHFGNTNLVVKVDQGIKKRGLQGLVKVNLTAKDIPAIIKDWSKLGWTSFLIEPVIEHSPEVERYLALERIRSGWQVSYSKVGGVDIESHWDQVQVLTYPDSPLPKELSSFIENLLPKLDQHHISFLEMNPVILRGSEVIPLDMACEVDDAGSYLPTIPDKSRSQAEAEVAKLDASTPASLKFKLLNPDGRIWVLLSGGGASLVLADEVADQGMGEDLANYGEYSGAPTDDDVYSYTKIIMSQLLKSKRSGKKAIVIAAGIANFTDVAKTFKGIIRALNEVKSELVKSQVKVFVRRGGPNEAKGLKLMGDFLTEAGIPHIIHRHETPLTQVISDVKEYL